MDLINSYRLFENLIRYHKIPYFKDTKKTDRDPLSSDIGDKDFRKYYFGIDAQRSRIHSKILRRAWPKGEKVLLRVQIEDFK